MPRGTHGNHARASRQHRWKPGGKLAANGYVRVRLGRGHPLADPNGYGYEHLVVWVSAGNPRPGRDEILHHVNGDKTDNRIGNLALMKRGRHNAHHLAEHPRRCPDTGRLLPAAGAMLDAREWREVPA
jgi:hypothetical protein